MGIADWLGCDEVSEPLSLARRVASNRRTSIQFKSDLTSHPSLLFHNQHLSTQTLPACTLGHGLLHLPRMLWSSAHVKLEAAVDYNHPQACATLSMPRNINMANGTTFRTNTALPLETRRITCRHYTGIYLGTSARRPGACGNIILSVDGIKPAHI